MSGLFTPWHVVNNIRRLQKGQSHYFQNEIKKKKIQTDLHGCVAETAQDAVRCLVLIRTLILDNAIQEFSVTNLSSVITHASGYQGNELLCEEAFQGCKRLFVVINQSSTYGTEFDAGKKLLDENGGVPTTGFGVVACPWGR
jgi:hypothetical protein